MFIPRKAGSGPDEGKWYMVRSEQPGVSHRTGYCASACTGHGTREEALEHHLQFQLDRESALRLERRDLLPCEICAQMTTLRARLGRDTKPFVLCERHQSSASLRDLFRRRAAALPAQDA